ncbi:MAG TPA: MBL fold metallo-hydrolase [Rhizomicrobium sp.]|jgi:ribonuclease Z|nr:MBL fold metallo-hydrolase [Rhizomicrobium sp.]
MKRIALVVVAIVLALFIAGWLAVLSPEVDVWLYKQAAARAMAAPDAALAAPNELSVLLVGTGSPLPDRSRAGPSTLIAAGDSYYVVDTGLDSVRNLLLWRVPLAKVAGVFITHLHSDHIGELGELRLQTWVAGRRTPLKVYGPPGIERVVAGFNEAYALDSGYRTKHHGAAFLPPDAAALIAVPVPADSTVLNEGGLKVTSILVDHGPVKPAYGYRFDFHGRSVTVSGDTVADENLAHAASGTDVLVHEALSPELVGILGAAMTKAGRWRAAKIMHDIPGYHTSPVEAARIANEAHARLLVYTHLLPILPDAIAERAFLRGVSAVRPNGVVLGYDGLLVRLPPNSSDIEQTSLK